MNEVSQRVVGVPALTVGAEDLDHIQSSILLFGSVLVLAVLVASAYFVIANQVASGPSGDRPSPRDPTLFLWGASALVIALVVRAFQVGVVDYVKDTVAPASALEVVARQSDGSWGFTYPNGTTEGDRVLVPAGRPVTFDVTTDDDPATFLVPEFRLRTPVAPNTLTSVFVDTVGPGTAHILEKNGHPVAEIKIVPQADFDEYMRVGPPNPYCPGSPDACSPELAAKWGADLYAQNACIGCHTRDGSKLVGPTFKGVYGRLETMTTGLQLHVDDAYIRESIRQPQAKIVKGFENVAMPSFATLSDRKVDALIAYLKTVK
jgi:cytochrome c oxidase subunit 2